MEYFVKRIDEPDFGCEGRPEGKPAMDKVWLEDENQHTIVIENCMRWILMKRTEYGIVKMSSAKSE